MFVIRKGSSPAGPVRHSIIHFGARGCRRFVRDWTGDLRQDWIHLRGETRLLSGAEQAKRFHHRRLVRAVIGCNGRSHVPRGQRPEAPVPSSSPPRSSLTTVASHPDPGKIQFCTVSSAQRPHWWRQ